MPFCTHEGSGIGHSESDIAKLCPTATRLKGLAIKGSRVSAAQKELEKWLRANHLLYNQNMHNR